MLAWLSENLPTIIICAILLAVVVMIVVSMIRNKKKGKTSCRMRLYPLCCFRHLS